MLNNVPLSGQTLAQTRDPIRTNFSTIDTAFSVDHVTYSDPNQGQHNKVTFNPQSSAPSFPVGDNGLYSKTPAAPFPLTGVNELFVVKNNGTAVPMTASLQSTDGYSYLASGIIIKWGRVNIPTSNTNFTRTFPVAPNIPVFNNCFVVVVTPLTGSGGSAAPQVSNINNVGFDLYSREIGAFGTATGDFSYIAIGR